MEAVDLLGLTCTNTIYIFTGIQQTDNRQSSECQYHNNPSNTYNPIYESTHYFILIQIHVGITMNKYIQIQYPIDNQE
jgi:hypothetical protein